MDVPVEALAPLTPLCDAVHENVAPEVVELKEIFVELPEHIVEILGDAVSVGVGFTVNVTARGDPVHPLAEGVME